jgi:uncharacterized protein YndB with AHSA1/START domain
LVWDAFTKAELLDQWGAPAPMRAKTKYMDFKVGGRRFYAMISPDGQERWAVQEFTSITPKTNFKMYNAFADKDENRELPGSEWDYNFSEQNGITKVNITIFNESFERLEKLLEGFKIGFHHDLEKPGRTVGHLIVEKHKKKITITFKIKIMRTINPWINFNGNAEEAFTFYKSVFGGEFTKIIRFKDLASAEFQVAENEANKIMTLLCLLANTMC